MPRTDPFSTVTLRATLLVKAVTGTVVIAFLDSSPTHPSSVEFGLVSGEHGVTLGVAAVSEYGWYRTWNSSGVPNGSYQIEATVLDQRRVSTSAPATVVVDNPLPACPVGRDAPFEHCGIT